MDKQTLRQYRYLVKEIEQLSEAQERLAAGMVGAVNINDMPRSNSIIHDRMAETACKMVELQQIIADRLNKAVALQIEIENCLLCLDAAERYLMRLRYIYGLGWDAVTIHFYNDKPDVMDKLESYRRNITNHHGRILQKLKQEGEYDT